MQKIIFLCIAVLYSHFHTAAQNCNLNFKGKIADFHDNTSIIGASVRILNLNKYTSTDLEGFFEFNDLCKGKIVLEIQHIACEKKVVTLEIQKDYFKEFYLEHHLEELNGVVVKTNTKTAMTSIEQTLSKKEVQVYSDKSLGDALKSLSGVFAPLITFIRPPAFISTFGACSAPHS